jgi:hypothetical protein
VNWSLANARARQPDLYCSGAVQLIYHRRYQSVLFALSLTGLRIERFPELFCYPCR